MRTELERRPLLLAALGLIVGLAAAENIFLWGFAVLGFVLIRPTAARLWLCSFGLVGLLLSVATRVEPIRKRTPFEGSAVVVSGVRVTASGQACEVRTSLGNLSLRTGPEPVLSIGDVLQLRGEVRALAVLPGMRPSGFVRGSIRPKPEDIRIVEQGGGLPELGTRWRKAFVAHTAATMSPRAAQTVDALCFNIDGRVDPELRHDLQRTGTTHIVSASGLHVFILAFALQALLARLPVPRWAQLAILLLILACYAAGAGMRPPILRSVAMAIVMAAAYLFRREADLLTALAACAIGYLLWRPDGIHDIGFQLSFLTVGALGLWGSFRFEPAADALGWVLGWCADVARVSLVATLAASPLVAYHFGVVSIVSIMTNVLIAFVLPVIIVGAMASLAVAPVSPALSQGISTMLVQPESGWVLWVVESFSGLPFAAVRFPDFSAYWLIPFYGGYLLLWRLRVRPS